MLKLRELSQLMLGRLMWWCLLLLLLPLGRYVIIRPTGP
jgi:hypothetical protein